MRKLNNKGMTIVEILVTFAIVATIVVSMYISINNMKNRKKIADYKNSITTYRDILIKKIEEDLIMKHVQTVTYKEEENKYTLRFTFTNRNYSDLIINKNSPELPNNPEFCNPTSADPSINYDTIIYAKEEYKLPNLGSDYIRVEGVGCVRLNNLRITNVEYTNPKDNNNIMKLKITLFHPDLGDKYSINIVMPIAYS